MVVAGPAAGHDRLKTKAIRPAARHRQRSTTARAASRRGARCPPPRRTSTLLRRRPDKTPEANHKRLGIKGKSRYSWSRFYDRFDIEKETERAESLRLGVEIDPAIRKSTPIKRTTLGRFARGGDLRRRAGWPRRRSFRVTTKPSNTSTASSPRRNRAEQPGRQSRLLDEGTLAVAKFDDSGSPLVAAGFGRGR